MNKTFVKQFIMDKLQEYAKTPSLSCNETEFFHLLKKDFVLKEGQQWREVYIDNKLFYAFINSPVERSKYVFTAHLDRIPNEDGKPYENLIADTGKTVKGQLDNLIAIAILRYVNEFVGPVAIQFTTDEERSLNYPQLLELMRLNMKVPISVDIDEFNEKDFAAFAGITLHRHIGDWSFNAPGVELFQFLAEENNVLYNETLGYTADEVTLMMKKTNFDYSGMHIGIPLLNYHSNYEEINWESVYNMITLLEGYCRYEATYPDYQFTDARINKLNKENISLVNFKICCTCGHETWLKKIKDKEICSSCGKDLSLSLRTKKSLIRDHIASQKRRGVYENK